MWTSIGKKRTRTMISTRKEQSEMVMISGWIDRSWRERGRENYWESVTMTAEWKCSGSFVYYSIKHRGHDLPSLRFDWQGRNSWLVDAYLQFLTISIPWTQISAQQKRKKMNLFTRDDDRDEDDDSDDSNDWQRNRKRWRNETVAKMVEKGFRFLFYSFFSCLQPFPSFRSSIARENTQQKKAKRFERWSRWLSSTERNTSEFRS